MAATMDRMEFLTRLADLIMESHKNGTLVTVSAYYSPEDYKGNFVFRAFLINSLEPEPTDLMYVFEEETEFRVMSNTMVESYGLSFIPRHPWDTQSTIGTYL